MPEQAFLNLWDLPGTDRAGVRPVQCPPYLWFSGHQTASGLTKGRRTADGPPESSPVFDLWWQNVDDKNGGTAHGEQQGFPVPPGNHPALVKPHAVPEPEEKNHQHQEHYRTERRAPALRRRDERFYLYLHGSAVRRKTLNQEALSAYLRSQRPRFEKPPIRDVSGL